MRLLIATSNKAKFEEFRRYFQEFLPEAEVVGLKERVVEDQPLEEGETFEENALIKARFYAKKTGLLTLADDGGFEIEALGGEPGVLSHRWPGHEASDQELVNLVLERLKGIPLGERQACIRSVAVLVDPERGVVAKDEANISGLIPMEADTWIMPHFPFRAVLFLPQFKKFYQNLTEEENQKINHRRKIVKNLAKKIKVPKDVFLCLGL